jgi:hypothetical protein
VLKKSEISRYVVSSLQHAEIGSMVIFSSGLIARIYDSCLLLASAYKLEDIISNTFCT